MSNTMCKLRVSTNLLALSGSSTKIKINEGCLAKGISLADIACFSIAKYLPVCSLF